jgi:hypothetical protein
MRLPTFRLRMLMISIAFLALILTVIMQAIHVDFEYFGHSLRLRLYKPSIRPRDWEYLE